jgi:hypothetical protein
MFRLTSYKVIRNYRAVTLTYRMGSRSRFLEPFRGVFVMSHAQAGLEAQIWFPIGIPITRRTQGAVFGTELAYPHPNLNRDPNWSAV